MKLSICWKKDRFNEACSPDHFTRLGYEIQELGKAYSYERTNLGTGLVAELLVKSGARVDLPDGDGGTLLHQAACFNNMGCLDDMTNQ